MDQVVARASLHWVLRRSSPPIYLFETYGTMHPIACPSLSSSRLFLCRMLIRSIYLLAFVTSLQGQTTTNLKLYATSAFAEHSLVATVLVV